MLQTYGCFMAYPLFSTSQKLSSQAAIDLRKPPRYLVAPSLCVFNNFLYACGGVHDKASYSISSARCFR